MLHLIRLVKIVSITVCYGLAHSRPRAVRLRLGLEALGPIFVKFGQMLSTRRDLLPQDIADELAKLQDQVPPFSAELAVAEVEKAYGKSLQSVFSTFDVQPIASASVAQVHFAVLNNGTEVAVKILRPTIARVIAKDIALLNLLAACVDQFWVEGRRLRLREVVAEFKKHLSAELDLIAEAANASQLRRNFLHSPLLSVPEIYWDYCTTSVMVMERMQGTPISHIAALQAQNINLPKLARAGVEIFFTQVFRDGFFHADMHPGNIFVSSTGQYIALDFGIIGTLTDADKDYLAQNFLAFFNRDYKRVAQVHIDAGWVPKHTRLDEFETAIRVVCEPIFDKPLKEISFAKTLLRLFQAARRFEMTVQPQLVLLQKTLLNIEGLGRELDPNLDLWATAKPFLEQSINEQVGWKGLLRALKQEAPSWATMLPQIPRLAYRALADQSLPDMMKELARIKATQRHQTRLLWGGGIVLSLLLLKTIWYNLPLT